MEVLQGSSAVTRHLVSVMGATVQFLVQDVLNSNSEDGDEFDEEKYERSRAIYASRKKKKVKC